MFITIITEKCIEHWNKGKENTTSFYSRLYFAHYKAQTLLEEVDTIKCHIVNLDIKNAQPLKRW